MITASMIHRYGIVTVWNSPYDMELLLDEKMEDRIFADSAHLYLDGNRMDYVIGTGYKRGKVMVQVIVFRSEVGYRRYLGDGALVFDN